jgi:RNA polymerase sigma-70 factor, ECF subfamily
METPGYKADLKELIKQLENLIDRYQDKFVHHAFYRLGNKKDAEDVVQDILVKVFNELKQGKVILNLPAFTFRLLTNACTDRQRKAGRILHIAIDDVQEIEFQSSESREEELQRQEEFRHISELLDSIPPEQNEIIRFRFVDGLLFQQIADILELPLTTVKSRFTYGILKIKTQFFKQKEAIHEMCNCK